MGLLDRVRSLVGRSTEREGTALGSVARAYVETGTAPDERWAALEWPGGEVHVLVAVRAPPGERPDADAVTAVETEVRSLGGEVVDTAEHGLVLARVPKTRLADLAAYDRVDRLEVTRGRREGRPG